MKELHGFRFEKSMFEYTWCTLFDLKECMCSYMQSPILKSISFHPQSSRSSWLCCFLSALIRRLFPNLKPTKLQVPFREEAAMAKAVKIASEGSSPNELHKARTNQKPILP